MTESCPICLDDFKTMKRKITTLPCDHRFCRKCLSHYAREQSKEIGKQYECPKTNCHQIFDPTGLIGQTWIKKQKKFNSFKDKLHCPTARCRGNIISVSNELQCNKCRTTICSKCLEAAHDGDCNLETRESVYHILDKYKRCPNCHVFIEKNGGCNHMHCRYCNKDFNWKEPDQVNTLEADRFDFEPDVPVTRERNEPHMGSFPVGPSPEQNHIKSCSICERYCCGEFEHCCYCLLDIFETADFCELCLS